ncbi:MAG: low molecular weight protein-tyrosine-phosphatase [Actinomycetales bacterium]
MTEIVFVCWGNICRSPMAERVARQHLDRAGLDRVQVSSAATSREETGAPIDSRARHTLTEAGYDASGHRAHQVRAGEIEAADLVVAMEQIHVDRMRSITGHENPNVVLLSSFDPGAEPGEGVPDPWYGGQSGFTQTLEMIERAMPGLVDRARELEAR